MVKFVSYTGRYPNLCSGVLTIKIEGKEYKFGHETNDYDWSTDSYKDNNFSPFWVSGGCVRRSSDWKMWSEQQPWQIDEDWESYNYPEFIVKLLPKLIDIFNDNVYWGCCGGCI